MSGWITRGGIAGLAAVGALLIGAAPAPVDVSQVKGLVNAQTVVPGLQVELKYSTTDNFMRRDVYGDFDTCWLQRDAAEMLAKAAAELQISHPELHLRAYDCLRPRRVQLLMWEVVKDTPQARYVANPHSKTASVHNYGCAIDLTLATAAGVPLDMGTPFDFFGELAHPSREVAFVVAGKLTGDQLGNRLILREVMVRAGFLPMASEWWHFNCAAPEVTRAKYPLVE